MCLTMNHSLHLQKRNYSDDPPLRDRFRASSCHELGRVTENTNRYTTRPHYSSYKSYNSYKPSNSYSSFHRQAYNKPTYKSYKPYKYRQFYNFHHKNNRRKGAYILAVVSKKEFINLGGKEISNGIYMIRRKYDGTATGETCAIIAIARNRIWELVREDSTIFNELKQLRELQDISGIDQLSSYRLDVIKLMFRHFYRFDSNDVFLFNIEPKGANKLQELYPCANLCIPGGCMEVEDNQSYGKTAFREFTEEVGYKLTDDNIEFIGEQKYNFYDKCAMYFLLRIRFNK